MKDNLKLVTVAVVDFSSQAEVIRTILEDAGINCYIKDNTVGNFMSVLTGGIKIQVESADEEAARRFLAENQGVDEAELERQSQEQ
ncbi:MAG: DUF2007 domain-containing protein [Bacteroidales bacterium]|jgi:hypothetical protein|nr:DUF2007 domain-containing protein [Bacteroidales bacterium]